MATSNTLRTLSEIITWARSKAPDEEVGLTCDDLSYPLAACHNELDGGALRKWSFTETYAEDDNHRFHYPADLQEVVKRVDVQHSDQGITARQLLTILIEVQAVFADEDIPQ